MTLSIDARALLIEGVQQGIADGSLAIGEAVRRLRVEGAGLHQSQYARMCKISVRTLIQIEQGEGNPTMKSLNAVVNPFGLQMGVVRRHLQVNR
jgi:DNA-binding XRE family transcriptional regulator